MTAKPGLAAKALYSPEVALAILSFAFHFVWEIFQSPMFMGMARAPHFATAKLCGLATLGDVGINLVAFWCVALIFKQGRRWIATPRIEQIIWFIVLTVAVTIVFELLATKVWDRWQYSDLMPVVPVISTGLIPILQWILISPLLIWFVHRTTSTQGRIVPELSP